MLKPKRWKVIIKGRSHEIELIFGKDRKHNQFLVDGQETNIVIPLKWNINGLDYAFNIEQETLHLVIIGNNLDVAFQDVFLGSGKPYVPIKKIPVWAWGFALACVALPIYSLGGTIPAILGILGAGFCVQIATLKKSIVFRVVIDILITAAAWGLFFFLSDLLSHSA